MNSPDMDGGEGSVDRRLQEVATWTPAAGSPRRLIYMIDITGYCSLECPVCYASSTRDNPLHQPPDRVWALGQKIRNDGGRFVQLMGGEPAEHPHVLEIIRGLRKIGLRPLMATNGLRLAGDRSFASRLRRAGLHKVNIQFDTFSAGTSIALRGRDLVALKQQAVSQAIAGGLRLGLIATICDRNVHEIGDLLRFALTLTPRLNTVTFQTMTTSGRFRAAVSAVGRRTILYHLLKANSRSGFECSPADIMPPPQYPPWRALAHPSCASLLFLCRNDGASAAWPLGRDVDLEQYYARLHAMRGAGDGMVNTIIRPAFALWLSSRPGARWATLQRMIAMAIGRGRRHLCVVHIDSMMNGEHADPERVRRCPACFVTERGFENACIRYGGASAEGELAP